MSRLILNSPHPPQSPYDSGTEGLSPLTAHFSLLFKFSLRSVATTP